MIYEHSIITKITEENYRVKSFFLDSKIIAKPGQFVMVWVPGVGERPMSVAGVNPFQLSIASVGTVSSAIHLKKVGEQLFFRGPLGNSFNLRGKKIALVGGGYGVAPMRFLAKTACEKEIKATLIMGARTKNDLMLPLTEKNCETILCTDDGSEGVKGFTTVVLEKLLNEQNFDAVYACGPEVMMKKIAGLCAAKNVFCELSLERLMKCGVGLCGSCGMGEKLCCKDGPIFTSSQALQIKEFGAVAPKK